MVSQSSQRKSKIIRFLGDLGALARGRFEKIYLAGLAKYAEEKQNNKVLLGVLSALARAKD